MNAFDELRQFLRKLRLDQSLLYLNHLLSVVRRRDDDPPLSRDIRALGVREQAYPFLGRFFAKWLIVESSIFGLYDLDWPGFCHLVELYLRIDDPLSGKESPDKVSVTGALASAANTQFPSQKRDFYRCYGLAIGLFRDADRGLREKLEQEIGMGIEEFMRLGMISQSGKSEKYDGFPCHGTFGRGFGYQVPSVFLQRVACTIDEFRRECRRDAYRVDDERFLCREFNPLSRYPLIDIGEEQYIAPDPDLLVERTTLGLYYDLFDRDGKPFADSFGGPFQRFVENLLRSICPEAWLWSELESRHVTARPAKMRSRVADWVYFGRDRAILLDCKAMGPALKLTMYGSAEAVDDVARRIACALVQLLEHRESIARGEWEDEGLYPMESACVIVTYRRFHTVNSRLFRDRIAEHLGQMGRATPDFVVLSMEELDYVVRLVELGESLDQVITRLTQEHSFDPIRAYRLEPGSIQVSGFARNRAKLLFDSLSLDSIIAD